jgi:hypothetical protein
MYGQFFAAKAKGTIGAGRGTIGAAFGFTKMARA